MGLARGCDDRNSKPPWPSTGCSSPRCPQRPPPLLWGAPTSKRRNCTLGCLQLINSWRTVTLPNHPSLNSRFLNSQRWSSLHHGFLVPRPPFCLSNTFPHHTLNLTITNNCTSIISGNSTQTPVIVSPNFPDNSLCSSQLQHPSTEMGLKYHWFYQLLAIPCLHHDLFSFLSQLKFHNH